MPLQNSDLLLVQSQVDSKQYKLRIDSLDTYLESTSGVKFKGSVDLNRSASAQTPVVTLPATNGDLYIVESNTNSINSDWIMEPSVTTARADNRIVWNDDNGNWNLITGGSSSGGTVTDITATLPLESDGNPLTPVISICEARTAIAADVAGDGKGTAGSVARLAEDADVDPNTAGLGSSTAVVTADLLKETNQTVAALVSSGGATTIEEGGTDIVTGALDITTGLANNVTIGVNEATFCPYSFSLLTDITE